MMTDDRPNGAFAGLPSTDDHAPLPLEDGIPNLLRGLRGLQPVVDAWRALDGQPFDGDSASLTPYTKE